MDFEAEIHNYISSNEHNGALLVTGKWGCGKTFTLKRIRNVYNEKGTAVVAIISLFGIDSTELLIKKVKESVFFAQISKINEKSQRITGHFLQNITTTLSNALSKFLEYSNLVKGTHAALSINLYDWVIIEKNVIQCSKDLKKNESIKLPLVLVFDDFERCGIDVKDLLGSINEYAENREIKTIIVADEDKIRDEKYTEFKEKVICRTIKLSPDFSKIISSIISSYKESEAGYKQFLTDNKDIIDTVFYESKYENFRFIKAMMIDFERIYRTWKKSEVDMKNARTIFYQFGVITVEHRAGKHIILLSGTCIIHTNKAFKTRENNISPESDEKAIQEKYDDKAFDKIPHSLLELVVDGEWEEMLFLEEIRNLYGESEQTLGEKFLNQYFWSLDRKIIEKGIPEALEKAYSGELCFDNLLEFCHRIHSLKNFGAELPCAIDYQRIENALCKRIENIRNGSIQEPPHHLMVQEDQIDYHAIPIKKKIEELEDKESALINYKKLISYLKGNDAISARELEKKIIDVFDNELLQLFLQKYQTSENLQKREIGRVVLNLSIYDGNYSNSEGIKISLDCFSQLQKQLEILAEKETDQMALIITNEFMKYLKEKIEAITTQLHPDLEEMVSQ